MKMRDGGVERGAWVWGLELSALRFFEDVLEKRLPIFLRYPRYTIQTRNAQRSKQKVYIFLI
jgi:hypothetical protein